MSATADFIRFLIEKRESQRGKLKSLHMIAENEQCLRDFRARLKQVEEEDRRDQAGSLFAYQPAEAAD